MASMDTLAGNEPVPDPPQASIEAAVRDLPDGCACTVAELAERLGIDKLVLIRWMRANVRFALLAASKVRP